MAVPQQVGIFKTPVKGTLSGALVEIESPGAQAGTLWCSAAPASWTKVLLDPLPCWRTCAVPNPPTSLKDLGCSCSPDLAEGLVPFQTCAVPNPPTLLKDLR